ncbi:MAG: S-layer homology domain-containing protein [Oscillospiraceae bacterium]|nr:S-layer homology domain-containing protein [Oscillospiraceae bacterium]
MKKAKRMLTVILVIIILSQTLGICALGAYASRADNFYKIGYRFTAEFTETDGGVHVELGTIKDSDASSIASLAATYDPIVYCKLYYGNGQTAERIVEFNDNYEADVSFVGASGAYVDVVHSDESGFAIRPDGTSEASYIYGSIDNDYDPAIFNDVKSKNMWYYDYIYLSVYYGFLNGMEDNKFCPDSYMTYAQAITLAARMNAVYYGRSAETSFSVTSPWYQTYIDYARKYNIPCDFEDYNASISRREYVHIFRAALPAEAFDAVSEVADGSIPDVKMTDTYADDIYAFYRAGILTGVDEQHSFSPDSMIKRSEVAAVICRMFYFDRQVF